MVSPFFPFINCRRGFDLLSRCMKREKEKKSFCYRHCCERQKAWSHLGKHRRSGFSFPRAIQINIGCFWICSAFRKGRFWTCMHCHSLILKWNEMNPKSQVEHKSSLFRVTWVRNQFFLPHPPFPHSWRHFVILRLHLHHPTIDADCVGESDYASLRIPRKKGGENLICNSNLSREGEREGGGGREAFLFTRF